MPTKTESLLLELKLQELQAIEEAQKLQAKKLAQANKTKAELILLTIKMSLARTI